MRIGIDIRSLLTAHKTGVGEYTQELLSAVFLTDNKNDYYLYSNSSNHLEKNIPQWNKKNIHYVKTSYPNKLFNASQFIFQRPRIDRQIISNIQDPILNLDTFYSPNLNFISLSRQIPHIITIHDLSFEIFPQNFTIKQLLWHKAVRPKKQCQQANKIIAVSQNTKNDLVKIYGLDPEKIKVIYPGISQIFQIQNISDAEKSIVKKKYNLPDNFILFLGTIEPRKNISSLIKAFENLSQKNKDISLIIAGARGWKNDNIYTLASKSVAKHKIRFIGYVNPEDKPALYSLSEIFVYPSFYEGFGFPVLEAMSCSAPVIASNRSSLPEITQGSAHLVNPNNWHEIERGMSLILNNRDYRKQLIKKGLEQSQKFSWPKAAQSWLSLIEEI